MTRITNHERRRLRHTAALLLVLLAGTVNAGTAVADDDTVTFGVVLDGPWDRNDQVRSVFEKEIGTLLDGPTVARFPSEFRIVADHSPAGVEAALDRLLDDDAVDMVLALGPLASDAATRRGALRKPTFAPFIVNRAVQGISATEDGTSGVENLNYIDVFSTPSRNVEALGEVADFDHLAVLVSRSILEVLPAQAPVAERFFPGREIEVSFVPVNHDADDALERLPAGSDAVYVTPLLTLAAGEFDELVAGLIERDLPSYSVWGPSEVERGVLVTLTPDTFLDRLARRIAINAQRVVLGESAENFEITFALDERMLINMRTAREIRVFPSWEVLTEATLIQEEQRGDGAPLSMVDAASQALAANLQLAADEKNVAIGASEVTAARSALFPQLDARAAGVRIDRDRARASLGAQAETTLSYGPTLQQVVYSEDAFANITIQNQIQRARERDLDASRLDVVADGALAFVDFLRSRTLLRIRRDNLQRTRSNLELAQVRRDLGASGPEEVYRWESEVARTRIDVIEAESARESARIALNRVRHAPLESHVNVVDLTLASPDLITAGGRLARYVDNPWTFELFREFMVDEALRNSPELARLEASLAAEERALVAARRSFWAPTAGLQAEWSKLSESGAGADASIPVPGIERPDDEEWNVALSLSIPLSRGGSRRAEFVRASESIEQLRLQRDALSERISERVLLALHAAGATYPAIDLTREAADAAQKTLELVTDAYSRGAVSILDLLDAQNAQLVAELSAENAVYEFIADLIQVERAIGWFYFLAPEGERTAFFRRLDEHFRRFGAEPASE